MSSPSDKKMKRTDTNKSKDNELQRTTSSYHGSVADGMRYSDRAAANGGQKTSMSASQLHKSKTLEERIKQAEKENKNRAA